MKLKHTFDTISKEYDAIRLDYPTAVFKAILKYNPFSAKEPILEIGIGTGIATPFFAKRGNPINAVDPGKKLLAVAKKNLRKYKNIKYMARQFEAAPLPKNHFALIYAAQAFHWVDPKKGLKKVHDALAPGGTLAFFWNKHDSSKPGVALDTRKLFTKYDMVPEDRYTSKKVIAQIKKSPLYTNYKCLDFPRVLRYSKQQRLRLLLTYSSIIALPPQKKKKFLEETIRLMKKYPDPLRVPVITRLILASKN